jgi:magnesium transporter
MIRIMFAPQDGEASTDYAPHHIGSLLHGGPGLLWVDFEANDPSVDEPILRDVFHFHPLAIDDALQESHSPKLDDWGDYLYIVMHTVCLVPGEDELETLEVDVFLGKDYLVTHHDKPIPALEKVWAAVQRDPRALKHGSDRLLYLVTDEVVAGYSPVVEMIDDEIDRIEDEVFEKSDPQILNRIFSVKRASYQLRRIIAPQREVVNKLARDEYAVIDARDRIYFRDIYDHLVRLHDLSESLRDLVGGTLDTYLSVTNNRMNDIMKTLTVITTLFMPLSFLTGFFGMNFFQPVTPLDVWTGMPAFVFTLGLVILIPIMMLWWIRRRGWM